MIDSKINNIIRSRKSVYPRDFNGKIINKKIILEILRNANSAPSHRMTQPWFYKVFSGESKMKLAKTTTTWINVQSTELYDSIIEKFKKTSHIICICMRRDIKKSVPEWEEIAATSMAVQNIWLSCVNSNIGGYWSTPMYMEELKRSLNLSANERCLGLFFLGVYNNISKRSLNRKDIESDVEWFN